MQNVTGCKQSAVLSSDLDAIRETLSSLLLMQFLSGECFGKLSALFSLSEKLNAPSTLFRSPSGRIQKHIYTLSKGENILSNSLAPSEHLIT